MINEKKNSEERENLGPSRRQARAAMEGGLCAGKVKEESYGERQVDVMSGLAKHLLGRSIWDH